MKYSLLILILLLPLWVRAQSGNYGTNLWLEISGVTNGSAFVVLHNVQSGQAYELMSKVDLTAPTWNLELVLQTVSNQNRISATVQLSNRTNALFFWAVASMQPGGAVSAYMSNGLIEWNRFNEGSGTISADASGNGNTVPLFGNPTWGNDFLTLDGLTQYGDAGSNQLSSLDFHDLTICAWINKTGSSMKGIVDKEYVQPGVGFGGWGFRVLSNNQLDWWIEDGQDLMDNGAETIALGQWTFVAVAWHYSTRQADFYINGVLNSSVNNGAAIQGPSGPADLELGNLRNNASGGIYAFDGAMHDVGIYNRALSAAEIASNFLGSEFTNNVTVPDLLYYKMTEHALTNPPVSITDSSTHGGTTGTIFSAPPTTLQWVTNIASIPQTALHFNGVSTHIDTSNSVLFNFTTNLFTINLWLRPLTESGCVMENGIPLANGWSLDVGGSYQVVFGTEANGIESSISTGSGAAQEGKFTMVTVVRTGSTNALIYINGIQAATTGSISNSASSTNSLVIGTDRAGEHFLDGDIWMPQIWGEALPPSAIANLYLMESLGQPWP